MAEDGASLEDLERRIKEVRETLEEEFRLKRREAQVRDRRARELLKQEQEEWEAWKRAEKSRLAQEAETLRRREENALREAQRKKEARVELDTARDGVEQERAAWAGERARLQEGLDAWTTYGRRVRAMRRRALLWGAAGGILALAAATVGPPHWAYGAAAALGIQSLVLWSSGPAPDTTAS